MTAQASIGVIGGSGLYEFIADAREVTVDTPFGAPSDVITIGTIAGRSVAFLPRHGRQHQYPPHRVPYQANLWALRSLGVQQVLAPSAVGSLRAEHGPGTLVIPDQLVDRTRNRKQTYYSEGGAVHVQFADPYCPNGRAVAIATADVSGWQALPSGTLVVIDGPRFSTRAESRWYAAQGWTIVGMTGHPEAALARELALCYTSLSLVTDTDAGVDEGEGVTHAEVLEVFAQNVTRLRGLLMSVIENLPEKRTCACPSALDGLKLPIQLPKPPPPLATPPACATHGAPSCCSNRARASLRSQGFGAQVAGAWRLARPTTLPSLSRMNAIHSSQPGSPNALRCSRWRSCAPALLALGSGAPALLGSAPRPSALGSGNPALPRSVHECSITMNIARNATYL